MIVCVAVVGQQVRWYLGCPSDLTLSVTRPCHAPRRRIVQLPPPVPFAPNATQAA